MAISGVITHDRPKSRILDGRITDTGHRPLESYKKLVGQRVTLENQIRGLAVVFGVRLPRALNPAFIRQVLRASEGIAGLSAAMRGLVAARTAVLGAIVAIDADIRRMVRASAACRRLTSIPGVGPLTALLHSRSRRSRALPKIS